MLFYKKKVDRMLKFQKEKAEEEAKQYPVSDETDSMKLTFEDIVAVILSALLVFGPVALVLAGLTFLAFKWLM